MTNHRHPLVEAMLADDMPDCMMQIASMAPLTAERYAKAYQSFFGQLTPDTIREFLALPSSTLQKRVSKYYILQRDAAPATVALTRAALATLIRAARRSRETELAASDLPPLPSRPRAYRDTSGVGAEQLGEMLAQADNVRDKIVLMLLGIVGLRRGEVSKLLVGDFVALTGDLLVQGKGLDGQKELVALPDVLVDLLSKYLAAREKPKASAPLILGRGESAITPTGVAHLASAYAQLAGIEKKVSPHRLRHAAGTIALNAGATLQEVQLQLRHRDPRTTQVYDDNIQRAEGRAAHLVAEAVLKKR